MVTVICRITVCDIGKIIDISLQTFKTYEQSNDRFKVAGAKAKAAFSDELGHEAAEKLVFPDQVGWKEMKKKQKQEDTAP